MFRSLKIFSLILLSFSLSSCVELVEEIHINKNLSGKYHLYLTHNGLNFLFNSAVKNIDLSQLEQRVKVLSQQDGISELSTDINLNKGRLSIAFNFSDAQHLTQAFYSVIGVKKQFYNKSFLQVSPKKIKRPNLAPYLVKFVKANNLLDQLPSEKILDYISYRYSVSSSFEIQSSGNNNINTKEGYSQSFTLKSILLQKANSKSIVHLKK